MDTIDQDQTVAIVAEPLDGGTEAEAALAKHPGGRPVKWTPEAIEAEGEALLAWLQEDESRFWVKDFAIHRRYSSQRFSEWSKMCPEFSEAYARAMDVQESRIIRKGWDGRGQSLAIFVLKNNHAWRDTQEVQQTNLNVNANLDVTSTDPREARDRVRRLLDSYERVLPPVPDGLEDIGEDGAGD